MPRRSTKPAQQAGVYGIQNRVTGKWYIGASVELQTRWGHHLRALRRGTHHSQKLQRSFNKHGEAAFTFQVLLLCAPRALDFFEQRAIHAYKASTVGYNVAHETRGGFMRGRQWPADSRAARLEGMKTFRHTDETRRRIKEGLSARSDEDEALRHKRIGDANRGRERTQAFKDNLSQQVTARYTDPAVREAHAARMRQWWADRKASEVCD